MISLKSGLSAEFPRGVEERRAHSSTSYEENLERIIFTLEEAIEEAHRFDLEEIDLLSIGLFLYPFSYPLMTHIELKEVEKQISRQKGRAPKINPPPKKFIIEKRDVLRGSRLVFVFFAALSWGALTYRHIFRDEEVSLEGGYNIDLKKAEDFLKELKKIQALEGRASQEDS